jgi:hypothetical protein
MQEKPISRLSSYASLTSYIAMLKPTWTTWSSRPEAMTSSSPTLKCAFGIPHGKLLGFIISYRGIEANPEKITAITDMGAPQMIKDVHKLTGCMVALNRFIL